MKFDFESKFSRLATNTTYNGFVAQISAKLVRLTGSPSKRVRHLQGRAMIAQQAQQSRDAMRDQ